MITAVELRNIKGFERAEVPLSALTLLSGFNGVGKSTVIQALLVRSQRLEKVNKADDKENIYRIPLDFGYFNLGLSSDIIRRSRSSDEISIKYVEAQGATLMRIVEHKDDDYLTVNSGALELTRLKLQYLNAERIGPRTIYEGKTLSLEVEDRNNFLGVFGELTSLYLAAKPTRKINQALLDVPPRVDSFGNPNPYSLLEGVNDWLSRIKMGATVASRYDKETNQSVLRFNGANRPINDGFGLSVVLPIIVLVLAAPPASLIIVENPEAHLHPSGQYFIGKLLCMAALCGHQVIIETHSDHILNSIRLSIKDKLLKPNLVSLVHFYRNQSNDLSDFRKIGIDETGVLIDPPPGFFDEYTIRIRELW